MSMEFVNRICPNCKNPNYMVLLRDFSKAYKYKCMNCNGYFNDIDFEKEPLQPVWKTEWMNKKVDMVEVVRCKDCEHCYFASNRVPDERSYACEKHGIDVTQDWYCADGERRTE
jgi:hypothetical protein